jgi:uncharacterized protein (DUF488 family)
VTAKQLFTIGYEGANLNDFLETLIGCGITQLIDVREVPISRKAGFSKNALREALEASGIRYLHIKALGDPKPGRDAARRGDYTTFRRIYLKHLERLEAQEALVFAEKRVATRTSCLLCFERDNANCHRSIIADRLALHRGFTVRHIGIHSAVFERGRMNDHAVQHVSLG